MTKKILLSLFVLLMGAVSIIAYNFYKNVKEPVNKTTFEAIPQNAALIIKESNFNSIYNKITSGNIIWEELITNTTSALNTEMQLHYLDSLLNGPFKETFKNRSILGSLHLSGANDFDFIFYIAVGDDITDDAIVQKIKNVTRKNPEDRDYDGVTIHTVPTNNNSKISLIVYKNTLAFSYSTVLIEDVIRQLNGENNLLNDPTFSRVISTSGQSEDGNLFVNNKYFSKVINQHLNPETKDYINTFENYTGWTELDIGVKPNSLTFNGFSFSDETDDHSINLIRGQKPQGLDILSVIPYNAAFVFDYGLNNAQTFFENRKKLLKSNNQFFNYQKYLDEQTKQYGIDLEEEFLKNIGNEVAFVVTESLTQDFLSNKYVIFQSNDIDKAKENLSAIAGKVNKEPFEKISFNDHEINKIDLPKLFPTLLGKPFINLDNNYYTIIDDYVVFANNENALTTFITNISIGKTLVKNENFNELNDNLSSNSNIFIYNNIARSVNLYKQFCKEDYLPIIDEKIELLRKFEAIVFQVNAEKNGLFYNNIYMKYNPVYKQETRSLWELQLDSTVKTMPQLVINHNTNAKEIIVQDTGNKLYLISNTGKIIWTKQLNEPVMGNFNQIDVYKNNKLQLLFNTKSKLYLVDRNGNNVESFPVKLPADASNPVTVMDYENNKNYRLLIGCNDNMVYNYTAEGKPVDGWEYSSTESPAKGNIWHFALTGKDYIVIPLKNGKTKIIERSGKDRVKMENKLPDTYNPVYLKVGNELGKTYLITADSTGSVTKLYFNDKKEIVKFDDIPANAVFSFFDFNENNSNDYIFNWDKTLKIFDADKKEIYNSGFQSTITQLPLFFKMNDKSHKTGIVSGNQIYLLNSKGEVIDGFPLAGSTSFSVADINKDNTTNLVVAINNMIYTYNLK